MTLKEMKTKVFSLIEEYYPSESLLAEDEDVLNKINGVINQIQMDLMPYRKISASTQIEIEENDDKVIDINNFIDDLYQIQKLYFDKEVDYEMISDTIIKLPDDYTGEFTVYYYKYPELCKVLFKATDEEIEAAKEKHDNSYTFELDNTLLEVMPYGVAADLLKMDMISNYGKYFADEYARRKSLIDTRKTSGSIKIVGGIEWL